MLKMEYVPMSNGKAIPPLGLGTFQLRGRTLAAAVDAALECGCRLIDSARDYRNESELGKCLEKAVRRHRLSRSDLFLSTKVGNGQQRGGNLARELELSLKSLRTSYLDLWLMHWPLPDFFLETWRQMEESYLAGKVKAIGVCNFRERHLEKLLASARIPPQVNQIEMHPLYFDEKLTAFCREHGIVAEAYCPLALMDRRLTGSSLLKELSAGYGKSIPQIILRWAFQHGAVPIPRTGSPRHLKENFKIFDFALSPEEMRRIDGLNENYKCYVESTYCPGY